MPPYLTEASQEGLAAHVDAVCAATDLGVIAYSRANAVLEDVTVARIADHNPNLIGLKDGVGDIERMTRTYARLGERLIYIGGLPTAETFALPLLQLGVSTYSSALFNFLPEFALRFFAAIRAQDRPEVYRLLNAFVLPYTEIRDRRKGYAVSIVKAGLSAVGRDGGPRAPPADRPDHGRARGAHRARREGRAGRDRSLSSHTRTVREGATVSASLALPASAPAVLDRISSVTLSSVTLPLPNPISDAKVFTGRQRPMTEVAFLFAEIRTEAGYEGIGFGYSKRAGGPAQFAHAKEIAPDLIGEDPSDIGRIWTRLVWSGASVGRSGAATQALAAIDVALWDLKAKRAGLPLAKLLGAHRDSVRCYNTSGGFLHETIDQVKANATRTLDEGIGGIKIKVGLPDSAEDLRRVAAVREHLGDGVPLMVDANQQWDRPTAMRVGRALEEFGLVWIEEPLDAYDAEGHAALAASLDTAIATGEMLTSVDEHVRLIDARATDILQPDAPRIGGVTQFLRLATLAEHRHLQLAPHFAMEIHVHLAAAYPHEPWVEHFDWLHPLFEERLEIRDGRMYVSDRPGLGVTPSARLREWTVDSVTVDAPH